MARAESEALKSTVAARRTTRTSVKRKPSQSRAERNEATRLKLLQAAARIIGRHGYAGCTIARVTAQAKIAHGTFYLYFSSQQDLFDSVLPTLGGKMLAVIADAIHDAVDVIDVERRGFEANFNYLEQHPYMYRVLTEAELFAPAAFQRYIDAMASGYARSLRRSMSRSLMDGYSDEELETIATMLIGARTYLLMRYGIANKSVKPLPSGKPDVYLKFISHGLTGHFPEPSKA